MPMLALYKSFFLSLSNVDDLLILFYRHTEECSIYIVHFLSSKLLNFLSLKFPKVQIHKFFNYYSLYSTAYTTQHRFPHSCTVLTADDLKDHYFFHTWQELISGLIVTARLFLITQNQHHLGRFLPMSNMPTLHIHC